MRLAVVGGSAWFTATLSSLLGEGAEVSAVERGAPNGAALPEGTEIAVLSCDTARDAAKRDIAVWRRHHPQLRVVAMFPALRPDLVRDAIQAGAWGCVSGEDTPDTVLNVLRSVAAGRVSFPFVDLAALAEDPFERLTRREMEVLRALANGWSNLQISARLGISENTVKYHLKLIYDKIGVTSRAMAVAKYLSHSGG